MPYYHDIGRDLRRLIPLGVSNVLATMLVSAELIAKGEIFGGKDTGPMILAFWIVIMMLQTAAMQFSTLLLMIMDDYGFPLLLRLPTLIALSAIAGAALFWWASPWKGAVCGLVTLVGWLYSIRDRLA